MGSWDWLVRRAQIRQHHVVLAIGVFEKKVDAVLLHQTGAEREIGLAVLHAIGDVVVVGVRPEFEIVETRFGKDLLDNILDVLVEKNPAVGLVSEQEEPGTQHQMVFVVVVLLLGPAGQSQNAIEEALLPP